MARKKTEKKRKALAHSKDANGVQKKAKFDPKSDVLQTLLSWFKEHDVKYDPNTIHIQMNDPTYDGFGMKVTAIREIQEDEELCTISKGAILSPKNCGIADILEDTGVSGTLGLTIALMYEMSLGAPSPWYGYLQSLPRQKDFKSLPLYWSEEQLKLLQNTDLETMLNEYKSCLRDDYEQHVQTIFFEPTHSLSFVNSNMDLFTYDSFMWCSGLVMSRAFQVDAYHGDAMVPLADIFNATSYEHVHFESDADVCAVCGSHGMCDCSMADESDAGSVPELESDDEGDEEVREEEIEVISMRMVRSASKGEEIYNTYGKLSNLWLLFRYGYTEVDNPYDIVEAPYEAVVEWVERNALYKSSRSETNQRMDLWKKVRKNFKHLWTDKDDNDDAYRNDDDGSDGVSDNSDEFSGYQISVDDADLDGDSQASDEHGHDHGHEANDDAEIVDSEDEDDESNQSWSRDHQKGLALYFAKDGKPSNELLCLVVVLLVSPRFIKALLYLSFSQDKGRGGCREDPDCKEDTCGFPNQFGSGCIDKNCGDAECADSEHDDGKGLSHKLESFFRQALQDKSWRVSNEQDHKDIQSTNSVLRGSIRNCLTDIASDRFDMYPSALDDDEIKLGDPSVVRNERCVVHKQPNFCNV
ncbi:hypothetical protein BJ742DRAFT_274820 [Cladochytrium replicatum]|nr:hypothetical protein BJ742DRAFT_274820 [Cladochytrium replicatum]